jgi:hypothetical protein
MQPVTIQNPADYGEFLAACAARNIKRASAYAFLRAGLFDGFTFKLGSKRFVYAEGFAALPARHAAYEAQQQAAA